MRYVVAILLFAFGVGTIAWAVGQGWTRDEALRSQTTGTIVEIEESRSKGVVHRRVRIHFTVDEHQYETWSAFEATSRWEVGSDVPVRYDPADPNDAAMTGISQTHSGSITLIVFGCTALLLSGLAFVLAREHARKAREMEALLDGAPDDQS